MTLRSVAAASVLFPTTLVVSMMACGVAHPSPGGPPPQLLGVYQARSAGAIAQIAFTDATHYFLRRTGECESAPEAAGADRGAAGLDPCLETGTYALSPARDALSLKSDATGQVVTTPFQIQERIASPEALRPLDEAPPLVKSGSCLVQSQSVTLSVFSGLSNAFQLISSVKTPTAWDAPNPNRPTDETTAASLRTSCRFQRGAMPSETIGAEIPVTTDTNCWADPAIPIQNIVVLMQENRSFDSYYSHLNQYRASHGISSTNDIESAPENASNPEDISNPSSPVHPWQHAQRLCFPSTNHEWYGAHAEYNGGANNGFFQANALYTDDCGSAAPPCDNGIHHFSADLLSGERALWWYDETDLPFYYALASTFGIADHYHSSLLGPTWPNRDYLYAATSMGMTTNVHPDLTGKDFADADVFIFDELERRHVSWAVYADGGIPGLGTMLGASLSSGADVFRRWGLSGLNQIHFRGTLDFYRSEAAAGQLPQVSFVDPKLTRSRATRSRAPSSTTMSTRRVTSRTASCW